MRADENSGFFASLQAMASRLDRLEQAVSKLIAATDDPKADPERVRSAAPQREPFHAAAYASTVTARLDSESVDPKWDSTFRSRAAAALADPDLKGVSLKDTRCGSSLCEMTVEVPDGLSPDIIGMALSAQGTHGGIWATIDRSVVSAGEARFYVAKADSLLPGFAAKPQPNTATE